MVLLYLFGFLRTILIIIGVVFVLKLIGQMTVAKKNVREQQESDRKLRESQRVQEEARRNYGKTTISQKNNQKLNEGDFVDYEEVD